jgi:predicted secreted hydrolase
VRLLLLALLVLAFGCTRPPPAAGGDGGGVVLAEALGEAPAEGFARATGPRSFSFPEDHGPHPDYRTEWWYLTANLAAPEGRRFGLQLTFFRQALAPELPERDSAWATRQLYLAHLAVADGETGRFRSHERLARGAVGLAGAEAAPLRVWLGDWELTGSGDDTFPLRIAAAEEDLAVALSLAPLKPIVLQGDRGWSRKGPGPGDASYYYSLPRLAAEGALELGDERFAVNGEAWLDREWSTSVLGAGQVGWDWLALRLDDGTELMAYRLRRADGSIDPYGAGTFVAPDGAPTSLDAESFELEPLRYWTSPRTGGRYPVAWRVRVPGEELELVVDPLLENQELDAVVDYWEGAVSGRGERQGRRVTAEGFLELTGYAGPGLPVR